MREKLTFADLNAAISNIHDNALSLISPLTGNLAAGGNDITGIDELALDDGAAAATAAGRIRRNGTTFSFASAHNYGLVPGAVTGTPAQHALYQNNIVKGWVRCDYAGVINDSFNVASITDQGTGDITVTWDRDFGNADYAVVATPMWSIGIGFGAQVTETLVGSSRFQTYNSSGTAIDGLSLHVIAIGDQ